jgi:hypothetical protein
MAYMTTKVHICNTTKRFLVSGAGGDDCQLRNALAISGCFSVISQKDTRANSRFAGVALAIKLVL